MSIQSNNKTCINCKDWFINPHLEIIGTMEVEGKCGKCLKTDTFTYSGNVCNGWAPSLLYDTDKPIGVSAHWVMITEKLPNKTGWYFTGLINHWGEPYTDEVYFNAENTKPHWNNSSGDKIYCWLDEVPELPEPTEARE